MWVGDVAPMTARGVHGCLYPAQPGGGPLERRCCCPSRENHHHTLISCIVTCVCSINSVLWEDWEVCAYSLKCSNPVGITPPQERQSFTMGCETAGELILWWSNCNDKIPWYCLVRWVVMNCHVWEIFWSLSAEKQNAVVCLQWGISSPSLLCYCFFKYMPAWCKGTLLAPVFIFFRHLGIKSLEIALLETPKCHLFQLGALLLFENPSP